MAEVWVFPYLHVMRRANIGPFTLVVRREFNDADAATPELAEAARGVLALYRLPSSISSAFEGAHGCVVLPREGRVGVAVDVRAMRLLHAAVVTAVLDENPTVSEPYKGHSAATSDTALLFGHTVGDGSAAYTYGLMSRVTVGGLQIGEDKGVIDPPGELTIPLFARPLDPEYADAVYDVVSADHTLARRLLRAIEWLDLVWRNTESLSPDLRIVAARAGFEVLLNVGDDYKEGRQALSTLLGPLDSPRLVREHTTRTGKLVRVALSDLEWWFTLFCFLRNNIVHGEEIADDGYHFAGDHHLMIAERRLRQAIKRTVADSGHPDIMKDRFDRLFDREMAKHDDATSDEKPDDTQ